tara:strand:- start:508 stop:714 length:207 start_codon:yes stop_codon:yes gene_type:complete
MPTSTKALFNQLQCLYETICTTLETAEGGARMIFDEMNQADLDGDEKKQVEEWKERISNANFQARTDS